MMDTCFNGLQFFDDKSAAACANKQIAAAHTRIEINFNSENQKLAEEVHKPITIKFEIRNVCSLFKE